MRNTPTPEQIRKLPVWTQEYIESLIRQRDASIRQLNDYCDNQTPSPFYVEEMVCTGEEVGPVHKTHYIQAHTINVKFRGIQMRIDAHNYGNRGDGIHIQWGGEKGDSRDIALIPTSYQSVRITAREDMYPKKESTQ